MRIKIGFGQAEGKTLVAKNMQTARLRDVRDFQRESGMKLQEIKDEVELSDGAALGTAIVAYLSLHNAGFAVTWDECLDRQQSDFEMLEDEQDRVRRADASEEDAAADPQPARTDSRPGDSEPGPAGDPTPLTLQ